MTEIKLGDLVADSVSGFKGIAIGQSTFLYGCRRIGIQPPIDKDGKLPEAHWFDEPQLQKVEPEVCKVGSRETGGPMVNVPTRNVPG